MKQLITSDSLVSTTLNNSSPHICYHSASFFSIVKTVRFDRGLAENTSE